MKFGIGKKLIIPHFIGITLLLILVIFSYVTLNSFSSIQKRNDELSNRMKTISDLHTNMHKVLMPPNDYLITGDKKERENFANLVTETASIFEKMRLIGRKTEEEKAIEDEVQKGFIELQKKAMVLLSTENPVGNKEAARLMKEMDAFGETVAGKLENFHKIKMKEIESHNKRTSDINKWSYGVFTFLSLSSLIGIVLIYTLINRGITKPLLGLTEAVKIISEGNLDYRIKIATGDEIEMLGREFNSMANSLKGKINEVTEHSEKLERANRQLDQNILQLYTLYNISKTLTASFETEKLLNQIVESVSQAMRLHRINIMLVNENRTELHIVAGLGISEESMDIRFNFGEGVYGWVAISGQAEVINNLSEHHRFKPVHGIDNDVNSLICAPFKGRGQVIGVINAYRVREVFDEPSFELLIAAAGQIGMALENARLFEETKILSITDGVTSLYNHRYFRERLEEEFERAKRYKRPLSLIMIDLDFFKKYNDTNGHPKGDELLRKIAELFKREARKSDIVARYGGEEFVIILPETLKETSVVMAERLRKEIESTVFKGCETQPGGRVTISLGISSYDGSGTIEEFIKRADDALYCAKKDGRNRVCV